MRSGDAEAAGVVEGALRIVGNGGGGEVFAHNNFGQRSGGGEGPNDREGPARRGRIGRGLEPTLERHGITRLNARDNRLNTRAYLKMLTQKNFVVTRTVTGCAARQRIDPTLWTATASR